ncbi:hypothetical protein HA520_07360 [Azotobacter chroococcum]|uniref:C2H2-type domain-containing protein n=1 Tax=Azotobacter chroococcum TaxID=353 RepID=A0AA43Z552_9GAMM|nr:hypothetical protein [Azotobacter chroococcum]NHN77110.1 hypothetical protein [Azotobacter chroococcum]TBW06721.1 hypothetical protein E0E50_19980 [Azotobacter chroococcum subsp. isscasi]
MGISTTTVNLPASLVADLLLSTILAKNQKSTNSASGRCRKTAGQFNTHSRTNNSGLLVGEYPKFCKAVCGKRFIVTRETRNVHVFDSKKRLACASQRDYENLKTTLTAQKIAQVEFLGLF